jgi:O-antigen/teichoic acid export membrane protein
LFVIFLSRLASGSPRARLVRGSAWMLAGIGIQQAAALVSSIAAARILGAAGFGELGLIRTTTATFVVLATSHLGLAASRYVADLRTADPARTGRVLGLLFNTGLIAGGVATALFFLIASPVARDVAQAPQLSGPLAAGAALIVLSGIGSVQVGALMGFEAFRGAATLTALEGVLTAVGMAAGAIGGGVLGAVGGMVAGQALSCLWKGRVLSQACAGAGISIRHRGVAAERQVLWSFVLPSWLNGVSTQPFEWISRLLLARGPGGLADVGIFSAAYGWGQALLLAPGQLTRASMPILTERYASAEPGAFERLLRESLTGAIVLTLLGAVPVLAGSSLIMRAYGSAFSTGTSVLAIVVLSAVAGSAGLVLRLALLATGRAWHQAAIGLIWGAALLVAFSLGDGGAVALARSHVAAAILVVALQAFLVARARHARHRPRPGPGI